jgi:hypothetical protein
LIINKIIFFSNICVVSFALSAYEPYVHFFTCIKKRTSSEAAKKMQLLTRRFAAGLRLPYAAHKETALRKIAKFMPPCGVLRRTATPLFTPLPGYVKWHFNNYDFCF